jgi:hypothetical protein
MPKLFEIKFIEDLEVETAYGKFVIPKAFLENTLVLESIDGSYSFEAHLNESYFKLELSKKEADNIFNLIRDPAIVEYYQIKAYE